MGAGTARYGRRERSLPVLRAAVWTSIWVSGFPDQREMVVTIEFADTGDGTEVSLTHEHFPAAEVRDHHAEGWTLSLDTLDALTGSA